MNPWRGLRGLPREVWILFFTSLINRSGTMVLPFLVLYLSRALGFPAEHAAVALTVYGIGALVSAPFAGRLCDRIGTRRVMLASLFLSGVMLAVFPFATSYSAILGLTFLWAVVNEAFRPAAMADIAGAASPEQRKSAVALIRLAINIGMSIGPAVGGLLATTSFRSLFVIDAATSLLACAVLAVVPRGGASRAAAGSAPAGPAPASPAGIAAAGSGPDALAARAASESPHALEARRMRLLLYFLAALLPVMVVFFQHEGAMPLYIVRDLGIRESLYGALFTVNTLLIIFLEVPLTSAMALWSHRRALVLGSLLCGAGFGALAFATTVPAIVASVVVWTFGEMIFLPTSGAYVADLAPAARRGAYMGLYTMSFSLAFAVGPWLGTVMLERFGPTVLWGVMFLCGCLSAAMFSRASANPRSAVEDPAPRAA